MIVGACGGVNPPISLLEYLEQHGWKIARDSGREEVAGLCPLHAETRPSFYVNRRKQVFYCHGCGRGGGLRQLKYWLRHEPEARTVDAPPQQLLERTYAFYQQHLTRSDSALQYLAVRGIHEPAVVEWMRLGYAPGACLRHHLCGLGYAAGTLRHYGLIDRQGRDCFFRCLTFPLPESASLYGRSLAEGPWRHRFLPGSKGGLYGLSRRGDDSRIIVVEGLFDVAALWQAGFPEAVAALGSHLNTRQLSELCQAGRRGIYLCFDADVNGSGPAAARRLSARLWEAGVESRRVELPCGHDPASYFAAGAGAADFARRLERARP
jgi:DNA primase